jgi:hypothetical protein
MSKKTLVEIGQEMGIFYAKKGRKIINIDEVTMYLADNQNMKSLAYKHIRDSWFQLFFRVLERGNVGVYNKINMTFVVADAIFEKYYLEEKTVDPKLWDAVLTEKKQ